MKLKNFFNKILNLKSDEECHKCQYEFRYLVYKSIFWIVIIGAIIPFAVQFCLPLLLLLCGKIDVSSYNEIKIPGVEIWNQYTGIILGILATIMSVVSMYLGFKNSDESSASERRTRELLDKLDDETKQIISLQNTLLDKQRELLENQKQMSQQIGKNDQIVDKSISDPWENKVDK